MLAQIVYFTCNAYALGLLVYVTLSWVNEPRAQRARKWLEPGFAPVLEPLRRKIKPIAMGGSRLDITPMLLLLAIFLVRNVLVRLLAAP